MVIEKNPSIITWNVMLIYLDRILSKDTFRINFKNYEIQLFKDIILPLLIITKKELSDSNNEDS